MSTSSVKLFSAAATTNALCQDDRLTWILLGLFFVV
jgi:hypothetical protein